MTALGRPRDTAGDDRADGPGSRSLYLGPVDVPDAREILASELRARILSGQLPEGASLPVERTLVEQTKLSRATVRESLRILRVQGLIVTRPGRGGGSVVVRPAAEDVVDWLGVYLQGRRLDTGVMLEARAIIEPRCAALAAERRTPDDLTEMGAHNDRMRELIADLPAYLQANVDWHVAVAEASHNELLAAFMHAISNAVLRQSGGEHFNTPEIKMSAIHAHDLVMQAIRAGDAAAARRRMGRHVHAFAIALLTEPGDSKSPASTPLP